eukprot:TRINITY_DN8359_c0_g2_i4.p1 TRINITY_DN8359_c0_g2~~TRINITY_DN8359_c0_g2_i4.p1  ORF type:complete len:351 (+),score=122.86 TRINITY_DN8359_c0_g2_i4:106-1158(+)
MKKKDDLVLDKSDMHEEEKFAMKRIGEYRLMREIGRGAFATVYKGRDGKGNEVAVKEISRRTLTDKLADSLRKEIDILKSINNENIIKLIGVKKTEKNFYLIMEYCKGGDLSRYLKKHKRLEEYTVQKMVYQISNGLRVLAEHNIMHRDLKLSNLLLSTKGDNAIIKIGDFGFARIIPTSEDAQTFCGTAPNMAPEVLQGRKYNEKADVWSMGTIIFQLITGTVPFKGENPYQVLQSIMRGIICFPANIVISDTCKSLIHSLLLADPEKRYFWKEYLEHPFVKTKPEEYLLYLREIFGPNYGAVLASPMASIEQPGSTIAVAEKEAGKNLNNRPANKKPGSVLFNNSRGE